MTGSDGSPTWRRYLRFWRSDPKHDVDEEVRFHIDSLVDELIANGLSVEEARAHAHRRFGDVGVISHRLYDLSVRQERTMRRTEWLAAVRQDIRFGIRQLLKAPAFTAIAVLTLGLGIGATSAIFSVVYSVLLHPLPYRDADRILALWQHTGGDRMDVTYGAYATWRAEAKTFQVIGATRYASPFTLTGSGEPTPIMHMRASASYWTAMYIPPVLGAYYREAEDRAGAPRVAVISHALWQNRFAADPSIIGRQLTLNGLAFTVVAVAPAAYITEPPAERIWSPLAPSAAQLADFGDHELSVYGLPRAGISSRQAAADIARIEQRLLAEHPNSYFDGTVVALRVIDNLVGDAKSLLYVMLGAVGLVLLIACGNVANLLIARAAVRRPEIAIRGALGATRVRIVSQMLVESLLLAMGAALVGLAIAAAAMQFLVTSPVPIARLQDTRLNPSVVLFTMALAVLCAVMFGLVPALRAARQDLQQTLRDGGRDSRLAVGDRLRGGLIVAELCLAQVLLIGAGLLVRSASMISSVPPGFDPDNLLVAVVNLTPGRYGDATSIQGAFDRIGSAIVAIPGVRGVARTQSAPIYSGGWNWTAFREGSNGHDAGSVTTDMRGVNPGYFSTLGVRVRAGREFSMADRDSSTPVAIISSALARRLFGDANPIGKRISNGSADTPRWRQIIGVVDDIHANGLSSDPPLTLYMPNTQWVNGGQTFLVRGSVPVVTLVPAIRRAVRDVDPSLALSDISTMEDAMAAKVAVPRFTTWLIAMLGLTGVVLSIVGVYGVIAYFVNQRTHELGVRMALGASGGAVRWMVVRQGLILGALGVATGVLVSLVATRLLRAFLFGVTPHDPMTFAGVAAVMLATAMAASYLPARRATRIDPLTAIRRS